MLPTAAPATPAWVVARLPVALKFPDQGSNNSAEARSLPAELPPTINTFALLGSRKAACPLRDESALEDVAVHVFAEASYISAEARSCEPSLPPITKILPSRSVVAECPERAVDRLALLLTDSSAGS